MEGFMTFLQWIDHNGLCDCLSEGGVLMAHSSRSAAAGPQLKRGCQARCVTRLDNGAL